jgi:hypothetical protein
MPCGARRATKDGNPRRSAPVPGEIPLDAPIRAQTARKSTCPVSCMKSCASALVSLASRTACARLRPQLQASRTASEEVLFGDFRDTRSANASAAITDPQAAARQRAGMNAVRAFIDRGYPRIAIGLLDPVFAQIP